MKTLFVALVALLFAFFVGCQDSITNPVSETTNMTGTAQDVTLAYKDAVSLWPGVIKLDGTIYDPIHNTYNTTIIGGVVRYNIKPILTGGHTIRALKVGLYVNAEFKPNFTEISSPWRAYGRTEEIVSLRASNQEVYTLDKEFPVTNTGNYRLKFALKFQVTQKALTLISMELKKSSDVTIGDPEF